MGSEIELAIEVRWLIDVRSYLNFKLTRSKPLNKTSNYIKIKHDWNEGVKNQQINFKLYWFSGRDELYNGILHYDVC